MQAQRSLQNFGMLARCSGSVWVSQIPGRAAVSSRQILSALMRSSCATSNKQSSSPSAPCFSAGVRRCLSSVTGRRRSPCTAGRLLHATCSRGMCYSTVCRAATSVAPGPAAAHTAGARRCRQCHPFAASSQNRVYSWDHSRSGVRGFS